MKEMAKLATSILVLALVFGSVALVAAKVRHAPTHHDVTELAGQAKGEIVLIGTIATLGGFVWEASPLISHGAAQLRHIPWLLKQKLISKEEAQRRVDQVDHAHDFVRDAILVCNPNPATGKCVGDQSRAESLLDKARLALAIADQGVQ